MAYTLYGAIKYRRLVLWRPHGAITYSAHVYIGAITYRAAGVGANDMGRGSTDDPRKMAASICERRRRERTHTARENAPHDDNQRPVVRNACHFNDLLNLRSRARRGHIQGTSHSTQCKNEYPVLSLGEETAVQAVVDSVAWAFRRLKKPRSREMPRALISRLFYIRG